jgi:hypothetical protein
VTLVIRINLLNFSFLILHQRKNVKVEYSKKVKKAPIYSKEFLGRTGRMKEK